MTCFGAVHILRSMRRIVPLFLLLLALLAPGIGWAQERRVALVIGNAAYQHYTRLANPAADARAIAGALRELGFQTELALDLNQREFGRRLAAFSARAEGADLALFYFAGHGVQHEGRNYLVPVDADAQTGPELALQAIELDRVLALVVSARVSLVFLDACRDPPSRNLAAATRGGVTRGLAPLTSRPGHLVAFSTQPNEVAQDGPAGGNSPYAQALLRHLATPGLDVQAMLTRVTGSVVQATGGRQRPSHLASLDREVVLQPGGPAAGALTPAVAPPPSPQSPAPQDREAIFWQSIASSRNPADFEEYLRLFPRGQFAGLARNRLADVRTPQPTPRPAPSQPSGEVPSAPPPIGRAITTPPSQTTRADPSCASPQENLAFEFRILQSYLMNFGLFCPNLADRYNSFANSSRDAGERSFRSMQGYFQRTAPQSPGEALDLYLRGVANLQAASINQAVRSNNSACTVGASLFAALPRDRSVASLVAFARQQGIPLETRPRAC
jgi:hypothetical protein